LIAAEEFQITDDNWVAEEYIAMFRSGKCFAKEILEGDLANVRVFVV
jgi:hypothetical protein